MSIEHLFVLMLENRSYDHLLGFAAIQGRDAESGGPTSARGLTGGEANVFQGTVYPAARGADNAVPVDPPHEFTDVLEQLCGSGAAYPRGGPYPAIDNSGFVASYAANGGAADPGRIMRCYTPEQLPVLHALAREFAVCDSWHASIPGPTWPNRMFVHAASSGGLDHSPTVPEIVAWETVSGFRFPNGTIFDRLAARGVPRRFYSGDDFPMVAALHGIKLDDVRRYDLFAADLQQPSYPYNYVFLEPAYDVLHDYRAGDSQHPLGDIRAGEALLKRTYEAIRNSPHWESSMLIAIWDEHGGFYDHVAPPAAPAPGDTAASSPNNSNGFTFERFGVRVPAVIVSPWIPKNTVDHRLYDHSSVPRTAEQLFGLAPLTERDRQANHLLALATLDAPRADTPTTLPDPAGEAAPRVAGQPAVRPAASADGGNVPAVLHAALRQHLAAFPARRDEILKQVGQIGDRAAARQYLLDARAALLPRAAGGSGART